MRSSSRRILGQLRLSQLFNFLGENNVWIAATNFGKEETEEGSCNITANEDPEDSRGADFLAKGIEDEGRDDGPSFTARSGDTMSKGTVTCREDFGRVAVCRGISTEVEKELEERKEDDESRFAEGVELSGEDTKENGSNEETLDLNPFPSELLDCQDGGVIARNETEGGDDDVTGRDFK